MTNICHNCGNLMQPDGQAYYTWINASSDDTPPIGVPCFMEPKFAETFVVLEICYGTEWSVGIQDFTDERGGNEH